MLSSFRNCFSKRILLHLCAGSIELVAVSIPDDELDVLEVLLLVGSSVSSLHLADSSWSFNCPVAGDAVINVRYGISHRFGI